MDCLECIKIILCKRNGIGQTQKYKPWGEIKKRKDKNKVTSKLLKGYLNETEMQILGFVGMLQGNKLSNVDFRPELTSKQRKMSKFLYKYLIISQSSK